jgi:hypothetical protein
MAAAPPRLSARPSPNHLGGSACSTVSVHLADEFVRDRFRMVDECLREYRDSGRRCGSNLEDAEISSLHICTSGVQHRRFECRCRQHQPITVNERSTSTNGAYFRRYPATPGCWPKPHKAHGLHLSESALSGQRDHVLAEPGRRSRLLRLGCVVGKGHVRSKPRGGWLLAAQVVSFNVKALTPRPWRYSSSPALALRFQSGG